jgi:hypothetical protein
MNGLKGESITLALYSIYTGFIPFANSVDQDQLAHLITIYTVCFLVRNNIMNKKEERVDPDKMAGMWQLI